MLYLVSTITALLFVFSSTQSFANHANLGSKAKETAAEENFGNASESCQKLHEKWILEKVSDQLYMAGSRRRTHPEMKIPLWELRSDCLSAVQAIGAQDMLLGWRILPDPVRHSDIQPDLRAKQDEVTMASRQLRRFCGDLQRDKQSKSEEELAKELYGQLEVAKEKVDALNRAWNLYKKSDLPATGFISYEGKLEPVQSIVGP